MRAKQSSKQVPSLQASEKFHRSGELRSPRHRSGHDAVEEAATRYTPKRAAMARREPESLALPLHQKPASELTPEEYADRVIAGRKPEAPPGYVLLPLAVWRELVGRVELAGSRMKGVDPKRLAKASEERFRSGRDTLLGLGEYLVEQAVRLNIAAAELEEEDAELEEDNRPRGTLPAPDAQSEKRSNDDGEGDEASDVPTLNDADFEKGWEGTCYVCGQPCGGLRRQGHTTDAIGSAHNACLNSLPEKGKAKRARLLQAAQEARAALVKAAPKTCGAKHPTVGLLVCDEEPHDDRTHVGVDKSGKVVSWFSGTDADDGAEDEEDLDASPAAARASAGGKRLAADRPRRHTPGPWEVEEVPDDGRSTRRALQVVAPVEQTVCTVVYPRKQEPREVGTDNEATARANAQLLAAAPDMAAVLAELLKVAERHGFGSGSDLGQVVAKAEDVLRGAGVSHV